MQSVSAEYLEAITATERQMVTRVEVTFVDNETLADQVTASGDQAETLVGTARAVDSKIIAPRTFAFADPYDENDSGNRARIFPADDLYPTTSEAGWWGDTLSDSNGDISGGESLTLTYSPAVDILTVNWWADEHLGYPVDFDIDYWNGSSWVNIVTVTGHAEAQYSLTLDSTINTTKLKLNVTQMSHAKDPARVLEFQGGLSEDMTERVNYWEILEEREQEGSVPVGNAATAQLTLELDNSDGVFYRNSGSIYTSYLNANKKIRVWCGVVLADGSEEVVPQGEFFTKSWKAAESDVIVKVKGWDRSKRMKEDDYSNSEVLENKRIDELVETIAKAYGLTDEDLEIDATSGEVKYGWFEQKSYWSHFEDLAVGEGGSAYVNSLGKLVFENRSHLQDNITPVATLRDLDTLIDMDEGWDQTRLKNRVVVPVRPLTAKASAEVYNFQETITVPASGEKSLTVFFPERPVINPQTPVITGGANISIKTWTDYAWGGTLVLENAGGSDETVTQITIDGQLLEEKGGLRAAAEDTVSQSQNGTRTYTVPDKGSRFIQSLAVAETMADDLLDVLKDPGGSYTAPGRGRPELELADVITVVSSKMDINEDFWILRMLKKYDGGFLCDYGLLEVA